MKNCIYGLLLAFCITNAHEPSVAVQRLYEAAQQNDTQQIEKNVSWHRDENKNKPKEMLQQARDLAENRNDAKAAVLLTTRLKEEQKGFWERHFRGITLVAVVAVVAGTFAGALYVSKNRQPVINQGGHEPDSEEPADAFDQGQQPPAHISDNDEQPGMSYSPSFEEQAQPFSDEKAQNIMCGIPSPRNFELTESE